MPKSAAKPGAPQKQPAKKPVNKKSGNKTQATSASVRAFIDAVADPAQRADAETILALMKAATGEEPAMWGPSIIGFGRYHYKYDSGREGEMCRIGFSPRKGQTVLYMIPGYEDVPDLMARLGKVKTGKSCLYIKKLADIDMAALRELIAQSLRVMDEKYPR
ncbi:MAG TPA: hypothetical protein DCL54_12415 [Alphaproteobacteria bacterium]|nr:hypothetical protein [Alphaproteobacteria bacterium]HAJ47373.1 hypothetical protein [Alphaproteobacteria bacterium]